MDSIQLHWEERGHGEPLVLLHGNGEDGSYFRHQMACFSGKYRVMAVDTRGHGRSPRGSAPFTIGTFAEDLRDFLDQRGLDRVHLLGFSDGGNIALTFALAHPGRVSRLILNGANLDPSGVKARVQIPIILGYKLASLFAEKSPQAKARAEMLGLMVNEPRIDPEALQKLRVRTLVIVGTKDMIKDEHTLLIARSLPRSRLEIIAGDHFIAAKNPGAFNRAVDEFLSEP